MYSHTFLIGIWKVNLDGYDAIIFSLVKFFIFFKNGTGYLIEKSFDELRSLDAGDKEKIPTLGEVFDLVGRRAGVNIELKGPGTARPVVDFIARRRRRVHEGSYRRSEGACNARPTRNR